MTLELSHVTPEVVFLRVLRQPLGVHVAVPRLSCSCGNLCPPFSLQPLQHKKFVRFTPSQPCQ